MPIRVLSSVDLPAPLRPSSADDLALVHGEAGIVEDVALAVEGVDLVELEQVFTSRAAEVSGRAATISVPEPI